jgi:hypothetical protein
MVILKDKWVEEDINHRSRFDNHIKGRAFNNKKAYRFIYVA